MRIIFYIDKINGSIEMFRSLTRYIPNSSLKFLPEKCYKTSDLDKADILFFINQGWREPIINDTGNVILWMVEPVQPMIYPNACLCNFAGAAFWNTFYREQIPIFIDNLHFFFPFKHSEKCFDICYYGIWDSRKMNPLNWNHDHDIIKHRKIIQLAARNMLVLCNLSTKEHLERVSQHISSLCICRDKGYLTARIWEAISNGCFPIIFVSNHSHNYMLKQAGFVSDVNCRIIDEITVEAFEVPTDEQLEAVEQLALKHTPKAVSKFLSKTFEYFMTVKL